MHSIPQYQFYKNKYGDELLIDLVELKDIKQYLTKNPRHKLTYYDITLITEGEGSFKVNDREYAVKPKDLIFTQPNQYRQWDITKIKNGYALIFEEEFLLSFFNDRNFLTRISYFNTLTRQSAKLTLNNEEYEQTIELLEKVKKEIEGYQKKDEHILRAILYQVLKYLDRIFILKENSPNTTHAKSQHTLLFTELIKNNAYQHHQVQYYADKLCITPNYLNELVKKEIGTSAKQLIIQNLLREAKKRLLYTQQSINQISEELHFEETSYFIRFFRKQTGVSPNQFRKQKEP